MAKEDRAAATVVDGSAFPAIDALPNCNAISKAIRAAGYRGSDFVLWHDPEDFAAAASPTALWEFSCRERDAPGMCAPDPGCVKTPSVV